jgi:hypothetical protein
VPLAVTDRLAKSVPGTADTAEVSHSCKAQAARPSVGAVDHPTAALLSIPRFGHGRLTRSCPIDGQS